MPTISFVIASVEKARRKYTVQLEQQVVYSCADLSVVVKKKKKKKTDIK